MEAGCTRSGGTRVGGVGFAAVKGLRGEVSTTTPAAAVDSSDARMRVESGDEG
jgi:hypothetical protein